MSRSQDDDKTQDDSREPSPVRETTPHKVSDKVRDQRQSSVQIARSFSRLIDSGQLIWRDSGLGARKEGRDGTVFITFKRICTQRARWEQACSRGHCKCSMVIKIGDWETINDYLMPGKHSKDK